ncbi:MAG: hypothetical protein WCT20_05515, partial [Candidatus Babeliales bacterium]
KKSLAVLLISCTVSSVAMGAMKKSKDNIKTVLQNLHQQCLNALNIVYNNKSHRLTVNTLITNDTNVNATDNRGRDRIEEKEDRK